MYMHICVTCTCHTWCQHTEECDENLEDKVSEPVAHCDEHLQIKVIGQKVALYDIPQCHQDKLRGLGEMEKNGRKKRFFCCFVLCSFVFLFVFACLFWLGLV